MSSYTKKLYYQDELFYEKNKDNFINSLTMLLTFETLSDDEKKIVFLKNIKSLNNQPRLYRKFKNLMFKNKLDDISIIDLVISNIENYINTHNEYLKFGTIVEYNIKDSNVLYLIKLPKGLNIYHASKKLNMAHVEYNIRYKYFSEPFVYPNYENSKGEGLNSFYGDIETADAYIPPADDIKNIYRNEDYTINNLKPIEGMNTFILNDDIYMILYQFDMVNCFPLEIINDPTLKQSFKKDLFDILDFSYINMISLYSSYNFLQTSLFDQVFGICDLSQTYEFLEDDNYDILYSFLQRCSNPKLINIENPLSKTSYKLYNYLKGIVEISDIYNSVKNYQILDKSFNKNVNKFINEYKKKTKDIDLLENIFKNDLKPILYKVFETYRGYRVSFYTTDYEIFNNMSFIIKDLLTINLTDDYDFYENKIYGYIATNSYQSLEQISFHQEMFFYDPTVENSKNNQIILRNYDNIYDNNYGINNYEFIQELRKYLTNNLLEDNFKGFHQGHLLEHSVWTSQYSLLIIFYMNTYNKYKDISKIVNLFNKPDSIYIILVYLIAFYHDIGKAGECNFYVYEYINRDPTILEEQGCTVYNDHFEYYDLSYHPEKSYEYLTNKKPFKFSDIKFEFPNDVYYNINLREYFIKIFDKYLNKDLYEIFVVAIACHWYFGDILLKNYDQIINKNNNSYINYYIDKISFYLYNFNVDYLIIVTFITMIISLADILGSHEFEGEDEMNNINAMLSKLPDKYKEIYLQLNKDLPKNSIKDIPLENTIIGKNYGLIIDQSMNLFRVTLKYIKQSYKYNLKNNYKDYYDLMSIPNLNTSKFSCCLPISVFIDINVFIKYTNRKYLMMKLENVLELILFLLDTLGNTNIVLYGKVENRTNKLDEYINELKKFNVYDLTNNSFTDTNRRYYDIPIDTFYKGIVDKTILVKENNNSDSLYIKNVVQPVIVHNFLTDNFNFKQIFIKGIYLAVWNFYINS